MTAPALSESCSSSQEFLGNVAGAPFPEWMTHFHSVRNFVTSFPWVAVRTHQSSEAFPNRAKSRWGYRAS